MSTSAHKIDDTEKRAIESFEAQVTEALAKSKRKSMKFLIGVPCVYAVLCLLTLLLSRLLHTGPVPVWLPEYFAVLVLVCLGSLSGSADDAARVARTRIENADDPRLIGSILRIGRANWLLQPSVRKGLLRILPGVRADHAPLIDDTAMHGLLSLLANPRDPELTIAVLKALEQVGDSRAIPAVRRLTFQHEWPAGAYRSSRHMDRIVAAAEACLPYLEQRAEIEQRGANLLRAVGPDADSLLRTVASTIQPEEQLLRTSSSEAQP